MSGARLRLARFGGDSTRAPRGSVEEVEESIRKRLYGERRMVRLLGPERSRDADAQRGTAASERPDGERATSAHRLGGRRAGVALSETSGLHVEADG